MGNRNLGRQREAMIREPGNLPFNRVKAGGVPWPIIDAGALTRRRRRRRVRSAPHSSTRDMARTGCFS